jgi:peptidoglycan hydrolase-like protein with peptidoglycan-binding domain
MRTSLLALALLVATPAATWAQPAPAGLVTTLGLGETVRSGFLLKRGDSGVAVRELQTRLVAHGHQLAVDGDFGAGTDTAVRAFQRASGLDADGLVGTRTVEALERAAGSGGSASSGGGSGGTAGLVTALAGTRGPPSSSLAPSQAYAASLPWARAANDAGRHTLVIAFEGLWAYSSSYARRIYEYQAQLRAGRSPARPAASGLSFVSSLLLVPNMNRSLPVADLLILPETSENGDTSIAEQAARAWKAVHGDALKVIIIGHSFGGYSAIRCGDKLARHSIAVANVLTVDARAIPTNYRYFEKSRTVARHQNFFQKSLWMPGYAIDGAENQRLYVNHGAIPGAPEMVAAYRAALAAN